MNDMIKTLMNHRSIRKFNKKPVPDEIKEAIIKCAQMAPTSSHFQAYTIINVIDSRKKAVMAASSGGQTWVENAPIVLLFCADLHRNQKYFNVEDTDVFNNVEAYTVAVVDTAFAAQKALIAAQGYGLGGVVVGGVRNDMYLMKKEFALPSMVVPLFLLCLGYPDEEPLQKPRFPYDLVVKRDVYSEQDEDVLIEQYNQQVSGYLEKHTNGAEKYTWTESCSYSISLKPRYEVGDYVRAAGFLQK